MQYISRLSIKSRLIFMLLAVSLSSILVIGILSWHNAQSALNESIVSQLTSIRSAKSYQIEAYFQNMYSQTRILAENRMIINAMRNFSMGYREALEHSLTSEQHQQVTHYYESIFVPRLAENSDKVPLTFLYRPQRLTASYFQYHYIVNNSFPPGKKDEVITVPEDTTTYSRFHSAYHPYMQKLRQEFGFYDIFLIELGTGNIVYSVFKETDFATSLREGPYSESGLGILATHIRDAPEQGEVTIVDYRTYIPSYGAPAGFVGAPIFYQNEAIGILAFQFPVDEIDRVMTSEGKWERDGLGASGETYLVGADHLMRSASRSYIEDSEGYFEKLQLSGFSSAIIDKIRAYGTTILMQPVSTDSVEQALQGDTGTTIVRDYRGHSVLSAYMPLNIPGLNWVMLSEIDVAEAFVPIYNLQRTIFIWGTGLILTIAFLAILMARYFIHPLDRLAAGIRQTSLGKNDVYIDVSTDDEFGMLAHNFNTIIDNICAQEQTIKAKTVENEKLTLNILPISMAERLRNGERIADRLQQVSVIFIHILGFAQLSTQCSAEESANILENLIDLFDETAGHYDIERVKTLGETYVAACGLTSARLDHASRSIKFATDVLGIIQRLARDNDQKLAVQIGINAGPVVSGVVGTKKFNFELWGETMDIANHIHTAAPPHHILITEAVRQRINDNFNTYPHPPVVNGDSEISVYRIATDIDSEAQEELDRKSAYDSDSTFMIEKKI